MEKQKASEGLLNVNVDLNLGVLTSTLDSLSNALKETGDKAKSLISEAVTKLSEAGAKNLKEASHKEGGKGEATKAYNRTIKELQAATDKGDAKAKKLLSEMKA